MNYFNKRNLKFEKLKSQYDSEPQKISDNGRYIILSKKERHRYTIKKNIRKSNLNYETINYKDTIKQKNKVNDVLSGRNVIILEKTEIGIVELSPEELNLLKGNESLIIEPDSKISLVNNESCLDEDNTGIDSSFMTYGLGLANVDLDSKYKGKGVKIAILDTGIDKKHPDLMNKIVHGRSWIGNDDDYQDENGHGTHCAGIAVGEIDPNGKRYGVAPEASLCIGKVLNHEGEGFLSNLLFAIDWAIQKNCNIISMSLSSRLFDVTNVIHANVFTKAYNNKVLMVAAAGNSSDHSSGITNFISNPAAHDLVNAIGAIDKNHKLYNRSNVGLHPVLTLGFVAPGVNIYSTWLSANEERKYKYCSGTSTATPFVAGIFALTISKIHNNLRPNENRHRASVERLLTTISYNIFNPGNSWRDINKYGIGLPLAPR